MTFDRARAERWIDERSLLVRYHEGPLILRDALDEIDRLEAALRQARAAPWSEHILDVAKDGWWIIHPVSCPVAQPLNLDDCAIPQAVEAYFADCDYGVVRALGRYVVTLGEDGQPNFERMDG